MPPNAAPPGTSGPAPTVRAPVVLGVGNILYGDEGVGVYAARALEHCYRFTPEVEIVDGATLGFAMIDLFHGPGTLIVLDALATDAHPGSIFRLPAEELLRLGPEMQPTAHEVDPVTLLRLAPLFGEPPDMVLIGIVPFNASDLAIGLTPPLVAAFDEFVNVTLSELSAKGVRADQRAPLSLDDVVASLVAGTR